MNLTEFAMKLGDSLVGIREVGAANMADTIG